MSSVVPARPFLGRLQQSVACAFSMFGALLLSGCGVNIQNIATDPVATPAAVAGPSVHGNVHGGPLPIQQAHIHLMETQSNGYGGAAKDLLATIGVTVSSDANGYFNIPDTNSAGTPWLCDAGQFAYLTVSGGYTVAPNNASAATSNNEVVQVVAIGPCTELGTSSAINRDTVQVYVSELSTVAAAYALANFITVDDTNAASGQQIVNISAPAENNVLLPACNGAGSSMTCTAAGLLHGFTNAATLVDAVSTTNQLPTGLARAVSPFSVSTTVPQPMINTIGNILQRCVDSTPSLSTACSTLFTAATPSTTSSSTSSGTSTSNIFTPGSGMAPTNTLEVALNMAKYPTMNVSALFTQQPRLAFFTPQLSAAPNAFSIAIFYGVAPNASGTTTMPNPIDIALDYQDNAYVLYQGSRSGTSYGAVTAITSDPLSNVSQSILYSGLPGLNAVLPAYPTQIATDTLGNFFVTSNDPTVASNGAIYSGSTLSGVMAKAAILNHASGIAVDQNNSVWASVADSTDNSIYSYATTGITAGTGTALPTNNSGVYGFPVVSLAIDTNQDVWGVSGNANGFTYATMFANATTKNCVTRLLCTSGAAWVSGSTALSANGGSGVATASGSSAYFPLTGSVNSVSGSLTAGLQGVVIIAPVTPAANLSTPTSTPVTTKTPGRTEVDGNGTVFWADNSTAGMLTQYNPATAQSNSLLPCYPLTTDNINFVCEDTTITNTNLRGLAIDSTGAIWTASTAAGGVVAQVLGWAAPTWPQLSYGHPGVKP